MLLSLGFGTQFSTVETVVTVLLDRFPNLRGKNRRWATLPWTWSWLLPSRWCTLGVCLFMFCCGLSMVTNGGIYILQLVDNHSATYSALILGCLEVSVMAWIYGVDKFLEDLRFMLGFYPYPRLFWKWSWKISSPVIVIVSRFDSLRLWKPMFFNLKLTNVFPSWSWTSRSRTTRGTSTTRTTIPAGRTPLVGASPSPRWSAFPSSGCSRSPELREACGPASANLPPSGAKKWSKPTGHCLSVDVISIVYQPWLGSQDAPCRRPWRRYVTKLTFPFFLLHMWQLPKERWS